MTRSFIVLFRDGQTLTFAGDELGYTSEEPPEAVRGVVQVIASAEGKGRTPQVVALFPLLLVQGIYAAEKPLAAGSELA